MMNTIFQQLYFDFFYAMFSYPKGITTKVISIKIYDIDKVNEWEWHFRGHKLLHFLKKETFSTLYGFSAPNLANKLHATLL